MEKIVIRKNAVSGISSNIICSQNGDSINEISEKVGKSRMLQEIFDENILSYDQLNNEYIKFTQTNNSAEFRWMYIVKQNFGLIIDEHITLCRYSPEFGGKGSGIEWNYVDSIKYIGDTWWFDDNEILDDAKTLCTVDFLEKYKGW